MTIEEVYNGFGRKWIRAMRELGLSPGAYKYWIKIGYIPTKTQEYIEVLTRGRFKATFPNFDSRTPMES
jgi:hypothetical protein